MALACGLPAERIAAMYRDEARQLFHRPWHRRVTGLGIFRRPRYDSARLHGLLARTFGTTRTLGDVRRELPHTTFLVPALDLAPSDGGLPANMRCVVFDSSNPAHAGLTVLEVAMRTAAAPMFFAIHGQHVEGGTVANNPAALALAWALAPGRGTSRSAVRLLSLGCGTTGDARVERAAIGDGRWGLWRWKDHLQSLVIETNMTTTMHLVSTLLEPAHWLRIHPTFTHPGTPAALRGRTVRLDVTEPAQLAAFAELGEASFAMHGGAIRRMCAPSVELAA
jgi:hypothetical protein